MIECLCYFSKDCQWEPEGRYLLSVSSDQSTRLHAPWRRGGDNKITWHELARPQIHGYDITCLAPVTPLLFATGADEKVTQSVCQCVLVCNDFSVVSLSILLFLSSIRYCGFFLLLKTS